GPVPRHARPPLARPARRRGAADPRGAEEEVVCSGQQTVGSEDQSPGAAAPGLACSALLCLPNCPLPTACCPLPTTHDPSGASSAIWRYISIAFLNVASASARSDSAIPLPRTFHNCSITPTHHRALSRLARIDLPPTVTVT